MKKSTSQDLRASDTVTVPTATYLSLVAHKLKGRDLFPKKTKAAKEFLHKLNKQEKK